MTHSERYIKDARAFHPERWLPADHVHYDIHFGKDNKPAFKPFSMGSRGCIGQIVGYIQGQSVLAKMIWYFDWELVNKGQVD